MCRMVTKMLLPGLSRSLSSTGPRSAPATPKWSPGPDLPTSSLLVSVCLLLASNRYFSRREGMENRSLE